MPAITPNRGPVANAGISPTSIAGCQLWLDAADATTITYGTGSSVASWKDKINNYAVANSSAAYQPIYSQGTIRFNGITSPSYLDIPTLTIGSSAFSIFFVMQNTGPASGNAYAPHFFWPLSGNGSGALSMTGWFNTNIQGINGNIVSTLLKNQYYIISYTFGVTTNFEQLYANGISIGTYQKSSGYSASLYRIGAINTASTETSLDGNIGEMLVYGSALGLTDRQNIEGYLAQKWGLTASLPAGHPGLTTNLLTSAPAVFRIGPLPGTRTRFIVTANQPGPAQPVYTLTVAPVARYSLLTSPSGTITNTGSSGSIGAATIVSASYTATAPSYITFTRGTGYILAPSITGICTLILIIRVTNATEPAYLLDARPGLGEGWLYSGGPPIGPDWTSATYYRDTVNTVFSGNPTQALQDSTWHHVCLQRASFTSAITFLARFSQNETLGCDCGEIMIFTSLLTAQEVKDNYNFFSSRFGWTPV